MRLPARAAWLAVAVAVPVLLLGAGTEVWRQSSLSEFGEGRASNVSIRSDGALELAPELVEALDAPQSAIWDLAFGADGTIYAAAGPDAQIFRLWPGGEAETFFKTDAIEFHAVAVASDGAVFAAASPQNVIYRITPEGSAAEFFDPKADYVWDLAFDSEGRLYVATGGAGKILRVTPDGRGETFFETGEAHVRALLVEPDGSIIAGADPGGVILRIQEDGEGVHGFVLYQSAKKEITALARAKDGAIFAAAAGDRGASQVTRAAPPSRPSGQNPAGPDGAPSNAAGQPSPPQVNVQIQGGSEIVRIGKEGEPLEFWRSDSDVIYSLAVDRDGSLLAGAGEDGKLIRVHSPTLWSQVRTLSSKQLTALAVSNDGVFVGTSNIGKVYRLGPNLAAEGTFTSSVFDAGAFSRWGRLEWRGAAEGGAVELSLRTSNASRPPRHWSRWSRTITSPEGAPAGAPPARFAQWQAVLHSGEGGSPRIDSVEVYYAARNLAPRISAIETTPPNYRFPDLRPAPQQRTMTLQPIGAPPPKQSAPSTPAPQNLLAEPGHQGVRWEASDPNDDALRARVEMQPVDGSQWILLEEDLEIPFLSWDAAAFPDGLYRVRVTVSDRASNPPAEALTALRESEPFLIDNTPPTLTSLSATRTATGVRVSYHAQDAASKIASASYSLDGSEWFAAEPATGLFDSSSVDFDFVAHSAGETPQTVAVRVEDERANVAVAKILIR